MARSKEFDRDAALQAAILTFAARGFEGTSTDDLLLAMGIGRRSMYDTFGDKRQLYLAALRRYAADSHSDSDSDSDDSGDSDNGSSSGVAMTTARM